MKKLLAFCMALSLAFSCLGAAGAEAVPGHISIVTDPDILACIPEAREMMKVTSAEKRTVPAYLFSADGGNRMELMFFNGNEDVAYLDMESGFEALTGVMGAIGFNMDYNAHYGTEYGERTFMAENWNGAAAMVDFEDGVVWFSDYDRFCMDPDRLNGGDSVSLSAWQRDAQGNVLLDADGEPMVNLVRRVAPDRGSFERGGYQILIPLTPIHDIPLYWYEGKGYMPVTTFGDLFLGTVASTFIYLSGNLYMLRGSGFPRQRDEDTERLREIFYSVEGPRPEGLIEYTYRELVMLLELKYGLKEEHGITDFETYFEMTGLKAKLLSPDGAVFADAIGELTVGYFGDLHSSIKAGGAYAGPDYVFTGGSGNLVGSSALSDRNMERFEKARALTACVDEQGAPIPYQEVGNTAYITFDNFSLLDLDYYDPAVQASFSEYLGMDQIALVNYAHRMINRENSPIENVVIDLSNNGGGQANSAVFVGSWVLGQFDMSTVNATTEAEFTVGYLADVNLDGRITADDFLDLDRLNVYCLVCENSFSCGNLLPAAFKQSGLVTLVGQTTGGGACVVLEALAADGTSFRISSQKKICMVKNGVFYSVDRGVEPDVPLRRLSHFYDREWLTAFINQIP